MGRSKISIGDTINSFTILECIDRIKGVGYIYKVRCKCGNIQTKSARDIRRTKDCGCGRREKTIKRNSTHGLSKTVIYARWCDIKKRCYNPNFHEYKHYGERGITMCDEWKNDFLKFYDWSMSNGYDESLQLDRIDNEKGYSPSNCRWVSAKTNCNNKSNNHLLEYAGEKMTLTQFAEMINVDRRKVSYLIRNGKSPIEIVEMMKDNTEVNS